MLKHATPRSSPNLCSPGSSYPLLLNSTRTENGIDSRCKFPKSDFSPYSPENQNQGPFNERGVDCDGIVSAEPLQKKVVSSGGFGSIFADKLLGLGNFGVSGGGIGPVITQGRAIVRRGLSFNSKKEADSQSVRSIKSEGKSSENTVSKLATKSQSETSVVQQSPPKEVDDVEKSSNHCEFSTVFPSQKKDTTDLVIIKENTDSKLLKESPTSSKSSSPSSKPLKNSSPTNGKVDHPTLKSLLRLPGVYGHIPVPENAPPNSPHMVSPDSLSLGSSNSFRSSNSGRTSSRSWESNDSSTSNNTSQSSQSNCSSTSEPAAQTTLKVYAKCLRSDIEYKTLSLDPKTTCRELINILLSKVRMRHRDPNLFYLTMEVFVRKWSGLPVRALLVLEENARPAQLAMCRPPGDIRFALQMRRGGVVKIHDTVLMPGSQYKSLLISCRTTTDEVVQLLLNCYSRKESKHYYALHEVCRYPEYKDRRLGYVERPLEIKGEWPKDMKADYIFVLRRNMTQALSLRKLFMKTSEVLRKNEELSARSRKPLIAFARGPNGIHKNKLIQVEAEPGIVVPEEAALIDCTSTTPTMTTFREANSNVASKLRQSHCNGRANNLEKNESYSKGENDRPEKMRPLSVTENKSNCEQIPVADQLPNKSQPQANAGTKRVHFSTDDTTDSPVSSVARPTYEPVQPSQPNTLPKPPLNGQTNGHRPKITTFLDKKSVTTNNFRYSIGAQTELTLISVKGLRARAHKWNSVETLIDVVSKEEFSDIKKDKNNSFSDEKSFCHGSTNSSSLGKGKHCEQNCKKCFYI